MECFVTHAWKEGLSGLVCCVMFQGFWFCGVLCFLFQAYSVFIGSFQRFKRGVSQVSCLKAAWIQKVSRVFRKLLEGLK